ncbi:endomucin [Rhinoderma darwinii]|uniref:endomucin n=1 Tax=Rhinoderma darwinii TaxID=43563 RepID=UPI003F663983
MIIKPSLVSKKKGLWDSMRGTRTMKTIGADTLFISVLILLTALSNYVNGEEGDKTITAQSTASGVLNTSTVVPTTMLPSISTKTGNGLTPTSTPTLPPIRPSDPTDNQTKSGTEATSKVSNTTDQYHSANASSTVFTNGDLTRLSTTHATSNYSKIKSTGTWKGNVKDEKDKAQPIALKSKTGIIIGVGCILAVVVLVVLIFLYKMCQKKPPAAENAEIKVSAQTKESVKLLSVKTATPYSDSKSISSNQMESIEC